MSWPHPGIQRRRRNSWAGLLGPLWNYLMAETASLEASVGREEPRIARLFA